RTSSRAVEWARALRLGAQERARVARAREHVERVALEEPGHHVERGVGPSHEVTHVARAQVAKVLEGEKARGRLRCARAKVDATLWTHALADDHVVGGRRLERLLERTIQTKLTLISVLDDPWVV